jgi:superfamily II DNA or RNA helicase
VEIVKSAMGVASTIKLFPYQREALRNLKTGSILCGGVGTGKSRTALAYYFKRERPKDLYIVTTARKRDTLEWEKECNYFHLSIDEKMSVNRIQVIVDSWNNIGKYTDVKNSFFVFDEQRVIGFGSWVKSFLKITKKNHWIILTATPGDTWMDYIPVFIANGFYKNRTEFLQNHVIYSRFSRYPKIDRYINSSKLEKYRQQISVNMIYKTPTKRHDKIFYTSYDLELMKRVFKQRWNVYENKPIKNISELCYLTRKVVNSDPRRYDLIQDLIDKHDKVIIFYNFDYELSILRRFAIEMTVREWNGHKHESIPDTDQWAYLVQYTAGAEGWNCIETNCIIFYSQNYSYKTMVQAAGRIDRLNTPFSDLYYYYLRSKSDIDLAITKALDRKQNFNEQRFLESQK